MTVKIRAAIEKDVEGVIECQLEVLESLRGVLPASFIEYEMRGIISRRDIFRRGIREEGMILIIAEDEGKIIGFAQGRMDKARRSWLSYIGVTPSHRGRGIGEHLLKVFITESRRKGAKGIYLYTAEELRPAIRLYEKLGFKWTGRVRRARYGVHLLEYAKSLDPEENAPSKRCRG